MNKDALTADLLALAQSSSSDSTRSKAAKLRDVLPAVEAALAAGTSREKVLETLRSHGVEMTLAVFNTTLRRLRAAQKLSDDKGDHSIGSGTSSTTVQGSNSPAPVKRLHTPSEPVDMDQLINLGKEKAKK